MPNPEHHSILKSLLATGELRVVEDSIVLLYYLQVNHLHQESDPTDMDYYKLTKFILHEHNGFRILRHNTLHNLQYRLQLVN